jgi:hypothetical protein
MNQEISEAIQHSIVPGDCADLYYPGVENTKKSCFPTYVENRYNQGLPSLAFGSSSTLLFNPDQGLADVVLTLALPAGHASYASVGLPVGWGYNMIESVGLRIAGSSYYTFTGEQLALAVLSDCEDSAKRDTVLSLGGQAILSAADFADSTKRSAYVYLKLPFNSISAQEKPLPLPTDLLTQPVQIVIKLKPAADVFYNPSAVALPTSLDTAVASFRQVHMMDGGNLLARREDMNTKALSYPLRYFQNTTFSVSQKLTAGGLAQLNLTGFRQGSLKSIDMWVTKVADAADAPIAGAAANWMRWIAPEDVELKINGLVYFQTAKQSSQMWSLIERKTSASANANVVTGAAGAIVSSPYVGQWTFIPFAQHTENLADGESENVLALGVPLQNSVVNVNVRMPTSEGAGTYIFNFSYNYASTLMFSRGSCEYVF